MKILNFAIQTAQKAGEIILKESKKPLKVTKKGLRDLVTQADHKSEDFIIKEIKQVYPNHGIIAEESSFKNAANLEKLATSEYIWIIDPLGHPLS